MPCSPYQPPHIVFAGGGSMEHLHPGLAVAERLADRYADVRITFFGDGRPIERHTVRAAGYDYIALPAKPFPRGAYSSVRYLTDNTAGYCAARWMLNELRANLIVGLGGHASPLTLRAAHAQGKPTLLLDQDSKPSPQSKRMAGRVGRVCLGFEEAAAHFPTSVFPTITGTPSRPCRGEAQPTSRQHDTKCLTVLGGVGGARSLNESVPGVLSRLGGRLKGWRIIHQAGEGQLLETESRYHRLGVEALVVTYIDDIADLLAETDLAICRSGGSTLAELACSATPALLVPDSRPACGSQLANARVLEQAGAALVVDEAGHDFAETLLRQLGRMLIDATELTRRSEAISQLMRPEAANHIANACCELLGVLAPSRTGRKRMARAA